MNEHETFPEHEVIEVHHQTGCRWKTIGSFENAAAINGEDWEYDIYDSQEELVDNFGNEIPADIAAAAKEHSFPFVCIRSHYGTTFMKAKDFDPEEEARNYLAMDLHSLIVIDTMEDAKFYAEKYKGHEWIKVQSIAKKIMEKHAEDSAE